MRRSASQKNAWVVLCTKPLGVTGTITAASATNGPFSVGDDATASLLPSFFNLTTPQLASQSADCLVVLHHRLQCCFFFVGSPDRDDRGRSGVE